MISKRVKLIRDKKLLDWTSDQFTKLHKTQNRKGSFEVTMVEIRIKIMVEIVG